MDCDTKTSHTQHSLGTKKWETKKLRSHGICLVGGLPKVTDAHGKRFPCTERNTSARSSLPRQFSSKRTNKSSPPSSPPCCLRHWLHCHSQGATKASVSPFAKLRPGLVHPPDSPCPPRRRAHPRAVAKALAGPPGSDGFEQRPPWLVSVASAGHFRPLRTFFGK